ncbi:MAG: D-tyrosyl-tRNA(Tyr) deacylase [Deltaproteobacteria bacterium]|nr:D-tyrosyl-tRNA(Tyr) deacylase [Deltaproteobacteria bacterium]
MRAVVQRVNSAVVRVGGQEISAIGPGLLVFLGVGQADDAADVDYMVKKICGLRIFRDAHGRMGHALAQCGGGVMVVPQFTLYGDVGKGNRPSFLGAADPVKGRCLYEKVLAGIHEQGLPVCGGCFQEHMEVELINQGPVTILLDSQKKSDF